MLDPDHLNNYDSCKKNSCIKKIASGFVHFIFSCPFESY